MNYSDEFVDKIGQMLLDVYPSLEDHPKKLKMLFERFAAHEYNEKTVEEIVTGTIDKYRGYGEPQIGDFIERYEEELRNLPWYLKDL